MNGLDVDGFITSQRAKLVDEKSRLQRGRVGGILPSDSIALERTGQLRKERQREYQEHLKNTIPGKSIAEIRRNMSREREREIAQNEAGLKQRREQESKSKDYTSLREKRLAEERRYQGDMHAGSHVSPERQKWSKHRNDRDGHDRENSRVNFENKPGPRPGLKRSTWDEEESDLMEWTRNQAHRPSNHVLRERNRAQTPPASDSPRVSLDASRSTLRSISAPTVAAGPGMVGGIAALGNQEDSHARRQRQMKYAEELRSQMKEKQSERNAQRRQDRGRLKPDGLDRYHGSSLNEESQKVQPPAKERARGGHRQEKKAWDSPDHSPPPRHLREDEHSPHHHPHHRRGEERRTRKYSPPPLREGRREREDYYHHHREPYGPPPPPPPRFQGGYGGWGPPYYPYPPPGPGYGYADLYFPSYHPDNRGRYAPPPRTRRPHPSDRYWDDRDRRDYEEMSDEEDFEEAKKLRRRERDEASLLRSDKEPAVSGAGIVGLGGAADKRADKSAYRRELELQMKEKKERADKERLAKENYDKKVELEIYDPFGKGGCGAPVRDQFGNLVADLKQMRHINENRLSNNSPLSQRQSKEGGVKEAEGPGSTENSPRTTIFKYDKASDENAKKASQASYRDYLRQQVLEKEEMKRKEKERQKLEEERELEQLERDRKRLQEEYQQELERQRRKEEEARSKNEAIKREAEMKRQMAIMQREQETLQEEAERRAMAESRALAESTVHFDSSPVHPRPDSPPVPTLRHKMKKNLSNPPPPGTPDQPEQGAFQSSSPPIPTLRKKQRAVQGAEPQQQQQQADESAEPSTGVAGRPAETTIRRKESVTSPTDPDLSRTHRVATETAPPRDPHPPPLALPPPPPPQPPQPYPDLSRPESEQNRLLTQLGAIRMHLQSELAKQTSLSQQSDIFDRAKQQKPKIAAPKPPRQQHRENSTSQSVQNEFTRLKYTDPAHRSRFLEEFPEMPESGSALEVQQMALIRHQQEQLRRKKRGQLGEHGGGDRLMESSSLLQSHTVHVGLDSRNPFADNVSRLSVPDSGVSHRIPRIAEPAPRGYRGNRGAPPSPGGVSNASVNTLEVDNMAARNEERLRRLEAILNAGPPRQESSDSLGLWHQNQGRSNFASNVRGRVTLSRQSELSLDCDTQHLPA